MFTNVLVLITFSFSILWSAPILKSPNSNHQIQGPKIMRSAKNKRQRRIRRFSRFWHLRKKFNSRIEELTEHLQLNVNLCRKKRKNLPIYRTDWETHMATLRRDEFARRYRMPEERFNFLLDQCAEQSKFFRELDPRQKRLHRNAFKCEPVDVRHKLGAAIRWCSGGSYLDIRLVHGISSPYLYTCVWQMVDCINSAPDLQFYFPWDDEDGLKKLERGFAEASHGKIRGCTFSFDGLCIRIIAPTGVANPSDFWHRKGFYAYVLQGVVNAKGRFVSGSMQAVGSTHDSLAWCMSTFYSNLEKGKLDRQTGLLGLTTYYGLGDDAYANRRFQLTPWPGRDLPAAKDSFNY